ncbi:MAG: hypothetical protein ACK57J_22845 [Rubrivivax sp.]
MAINRIQFQHGMSLLEFNSRYGTESQWSPLQNLWNPHEHWLCGVNANGGNSRIPFQ